MPSLWVRSTASTPFVDSAPARGRWASVVPGGAALRDPWGSSRTSAWRTTRPFTGRDEMSASDLRHHGIAPSAAGTTRSMSCRRPATSPEPGPPPRPLPAPPRISGPPCSPLSCTSAEAAAADRPPGEDQQGSCTADRIDTASDLPPLSAAHCATHRAYRSGSLPSWRKHAHAEPGHAFESIPAPKTLLAARTHCTAGEHPAVRHRPGRPRLVTGIRRRGMLPARLVRTGHQQRLFGSCRQGSQELVQ